MQADAATRTMLALALRYPHLINQNLEVLGQLQPPAGELADLTTALLRAATGGVEGADIVDTLTNGLFATVAQDLLRSTGVATLGAEANAEQLFAQAANQWHTHSSTLSHRQHLLNQLKSGQLTAENWHSLQQSITK
jgi:hypothetical protein